MSNHITIYIGKKRKELIKKYRINATQLFKKALDERLKQILGKPPEIEDNPKYIILVRCPNCHKYYQTSTVKRATCPECGTMMRVYTKKHGLRGKVLEGKEEVLKEIQRLFWGKPVL